MSSVLRQLWEHWVGVDDVRTPDLVPQPLVASPHAVRIAGAQLYFAHEDWPTRCWADDCTRDAAGELGLCAVHLDEKRAT